MGRRFGWWLVLALALGCASGDEPRVGTSHDPLYAFPASATVSWAEEGNVLPDDPRIARLDLGALIQRVAAEEFAARGYAPTGSSADYVLSYQVRIDWFKVETSQMLGSLTLQLAERASRQRVWSGFARSAVNPALAPEEREKRLRGAIRRMLESFPPGLAR